MSSSDDRRRPRVAGQRRRHGRPVTDPQAATSPALDEPAEALAEPVPEAAEAPRQPAAAPDQPDATPEEPVEEAAPSEPAAEEAAVDGAPDEDASDESAPDEDAGAAGRRLPPGVRAPLVALVVALVAFALVLAVSLRDPHARERDARAATAQARTSLEQLLSYSYQTLDAQAQRNAALLTGSFKQEYAATMARTIAPVAEKEKVTVQARSYEAGVMGQTPDTVTVQVFLNQAKTSESEKQPSIDQNRVIATLRKVGGRWLIEKLSAY